MKKYRDAPEGIATSSDCPRAGAVYLRARYEDYEGVVMKTTCKTWRCLGCRNKLVALFKARVSTGVFHLAQCAFITITYKAGVERGPPARYVKTDWAALLRRLKRHEPLIAAMKWLRIVELTKRKTPHHHLVLGTIPDEIPIRCWRGQLRVADYQARFEDCACLAHRFARQWLSVTSDSYIIHATPVVGGVGAGSYMAKYLMKGFMDSSRETALGMKRRWSSSRGWPGSGKLMLARTLEEGWYEIEFVFGHVDVERLGGPAYLLERIGDDIVKAAAERNSIRRLLKLGGHHD